MATDRALRRRVVARGGDEDLVRGIVGSTVPGVSVLNVTVRFSSAGSGEADGVVSSKVSRRKDRR